MKVPYEMYAFLKARKDSKFTVERIPAKKQIKNRIVHDFTALPIGISHRDFIQICQ